MTVVLAATIVVLLAAWTLERRDRNNLHAGVLSAIERERELWHRERQMLLNRIKPETAQYVPEAGPVQDPPAPRFDDDAAWWQATLSKDELAERMLRDELAANVAGGE